MNIGTKIILYGTILIVCITFVGIYAPDGCKDKHAYSYGICKPNDTPMVVVLHGTTPPPIKMEFHVRVDVFCLPPNCIQEEWFINYTSNNWNTSNSIMTSFYTYEPVQQAMLFSDYDEAIAYAKEHCTSTLACEAINEKSMRHFIRMREEQTKKDSIGRTKHKLIR
jgi:hypothetical protein